MERRMKEVIRYLGYGNHAVEAQTLEMIESSLLELEEKTSAKSFYRIFDIEREADEKVTIGIMH
ncbi:MAG: Vitamin B12 dependent methionine synthase activation subunit, partial [Lachnospiraceae bacterium]|nr:Vitamin B12 dependent methionine synthase activation subunit [Lachnospiraceae bacterium]